MVKEISSAGKNRGKLEEIYEYFYDVWFMFGLLSGDEHITEVQIQRAKVTSVAITKDIDGIKRIVVSMLIKTADIQWDNRFVLEKMQWFKYPNC